MNASYPRWFQDFLLNSLATQVRKHLQEHNFMLKTEHLPRQALDKHRKS